MQAIWEVYAWGPERWDLANLSPAAADVRAPQLSTHVPRPCLWAGARKALWASALPAPAPCASLGNEDGCTPLQQPAQEPQRHGQASLPLPLLLQGVTSARGERRVTSVRAVITWATAAVAAIPVGGHLQSLPQVVFLTEAASWNIFKILRDPYTEGTREKMYFYKNLTGSRACQHPLVTLRNDAVEEKQHLSGWLSPAPLVCTGTHIRLPGSCKPQLDKPFAGGEREHSLLALQPKLPSGGSCSEFSSLKPNLCAWWHLCSNPGAGVGGEILQLLPAWLGTHEEQGGDTWRWNTPCPLSSSSVPPKQAYFDRLRDNLSYLRRWMISTYPSFKDVCSVLWGQGGKRCVAGTFTSALCRLQGDFKGSLWHRILTTTEPSLSTHP